MKRIILYSFIFFFISSQSYSQEFIYNRGLATICVGAAIPSYDFGTKKGISLTSYAKLGTTITGEVSYFHNWNVGFNFLLSYTVNQVSINQLEEAYMNESPAFTSVTAESEAFRDIAGFGGMIFDVPVNEFFSATFKMMAGLRNVYKPSVLVKTSTVYSKIDYYETYDNKMAFALYFAGGARIKINDYFNVNINASYVGSTLDFEYRRNSKTINQTAHIGVLSFTGGVSYAF